MSKITSHDAMGCSYIIVDRTFADIRKRKYETSVYLKGIKSMQSVKIG